MGSFAKEASDLPPFSWVDNCAPRKRYKAMELNLEITDLARSGAGLGLNIVQRYVEVLGGKVELLPVPRGASFRVSVPTGVGRITAG